MRSHSHGDAIDSTDDAGKKPRNRAPPPPPSKTKNKPPRGFVHQLSHQPFSIPPPPPSQPPAQTSSDVSRVTTGGGAGREGGEYARVTKPPPAYKRTKSDQKLSEDGGDKKTGSPRERDRGQKSAGSTSSSPYQSPLPIRKSGDTPSADGRGGKSSGYGSGGEGVMRGGGRLGELAPPSRPPPRAPVGAAGKKRWSVAEVEGEGRRREDSPLLMVSI